MLTIQVSSEKTTGKMGRKTTEWTFPTSNKQDLTRENLAMAKGKFKRETQSFLIAAQYNAIRTMSKQV